MLDYNTSSAWAVGTGIWISFEVAYARSGTVKVVVNKSWYRSWDACSIVDKNNISIHNGISIATMDSQLQVTQASAQTCSAFGPPVPESQSTFTFNVVAGGKAQFDFVAESRGNLSGSGEVATLVFTPAP
jgi:hypothetical protein